jgi:hypothetical protein
VTTLGVWAVHGRLVTREWDGTRYTTPPSWWNPSPTYDVHIDTQEPDMARKARTETQTAPLTRGNLERAAQLARRAATELEAFIPYWDENAEDMPSTASATSALADALTELGA